MIPLDPQPLHATLVARFVEGTWRGVLLRGPSGAGKSDLALRLIGRGWRLVADDRVLVWRSGGGIWGRAPEVLAGLLEVRAIGVAPCSSLRFSAIDRVIDCAADPQALERVPLEARLDLCGVTLPRLAIDARTSSAADKVAVFCHRLRL